jgi:hypothetical protein
MKHLKIILLLVSHSIVYAQTLVQREVIKSSISKEDSIKSIIYWQNYKNKKNKRVEEYLNKHPNTPKSYFKNNKLYVLYDVTKDGKPLYINTKKKK